MSDLWRRLEGLGIDLASARRATTHGGARGGTGIDLDVLECPVCFETCLPPSYSCSNGHLVCGKCVDKGVLQCPICRERPLTVSEDLESFTRRFHFKCINHVMGCTKTFSGYDANRHEETCSFRPIQCLVQGCGIKVPFCTGLRQHLVECHEEFIGYKLQKIIKDLLIPPGHDVDYKWPVRYILFQNTAVAVHFEIKGQSVRAWGDIQGHNKTTDLSIGLTFYSGGITQGEPKEGESTLKWTGPVLGDNLSDNGNLVFKTSLDTLKPYLKTGGRELTLFAQIFVPPNSSAIGWASQTKDLEWIPKCSHYLRNCSLLCSNPTCNGIFGCRICHDDVKTDHKLNRHAVRFVFCHKCATQVLAEKNCGSCGVLFAKYFCSVCHFYEDGNDPRLFFHCTKCGICRRRADVTTQYTHCNSCGICVPSSTLNSHGCRANSAKQNCGVCSKDLHSSKEAISSYSCGHYLHVSCRERVTIEMNDRCPTCFH